jgi:hypothetical protein
MNVPNLVNYARRRLLDQSSNLAAVPYNGEQTTDISYIPISICTGSFPAVPDATKKQNQSQTPPLPSPPAEPSPPTEPSQDGKQTSEEQPKTSGNLWKYILIIVAAVVLVIGIVVLLCICRKPAAKIIKPWNTGISGQLQKAFVTGNSSNR